MGVQLPGEEVLWTGQPDPSVIFSKKDLFLIPLTIVSLGLMMWVFKDILDNRIYKIIAIIYFIFAFLYFLVGRFVIKDRKKKHTFYVITNKRALIFIDNSIGNTKEVYLNKLHTLTRDIKSDGHGTIYFGEKPGPNAWFDNTGIEYMGESYGEPPFTFHDIRKVIEVYELVNGFVEKNL